MQGTAPTSYQRMPWPALWLAHWWDDEVFEQYPTWEACVAGPLFSADQLERYFGPPIESNAGILGGAGAYKKGVKYGIGREVLAKILEGTETPLRTRLAIQVWNKALSSPRAWAKTGSKVEPVSETYQSLGISKATAYRLQRPTSMPRP